MCTRWKEKWLVGSGKKSGVSESDRSVEEGSALEFLQPLGENFLCQFGALTTLPSHTVFAA